MRAFLLRRLLHAVFVTWGVVTVVFFLVRLTGDPTLFLVDQSATQEEIAHTRALLGLDRPLAVQYVDFLGAALRGDFGASIREKRPAMRMVLDHFWPATVELAAAALVLSTVLAVPLGVISATHRGRAADHASRLASLFLQSMPWCWAACCPPTAPGRGDTSCCRRSRWRRRRSRRTCGSSARACSRCSARTT